MDADTGVVMEVKAAPDIYPIKIISDGPKGSCAQYHEVRLIEIYSLTKQPYINDNNNVDGNDDGGYNDSIVTVSNPMTKKDYQQHDNNNKIAE